MISPTRSWKPAAAVGQLGARCAGDGSRTAGIFADASKVHRVKLRRRWVQSRGPLTVPRSPQGRPILMQAGSSPRGRDFGARWGEIIFTLQHAKSDMQEFRADMRARAARAGRNPDDCRILVSVDPIVGETRAIAEAKARLCQQPGRSGTRPRAGVRAYCDGFFQIPAGPTDRGDGADGRLARLVRRHTAGHPLGRPDPRPGGAAFCGQRALPADRRQPTDIADELQDLFEAKACDGFRPYPDGVPRHVRAVSRAVVPELQRRELFRTSYPGTTLRDTLNA